MTLQEQIFSIKNNEGFEATTMEVFDYQFKNNSIYREFCSGQDAESPTLQTQYHQLPPPWRLLAVPV